MKELIKKYQDLTIWRVAIIIALWGPVPIAVIKLQAEYLDPTLIGVIFTIGSIYGVFHSRLNKMLTLMSAVYWAAVMNIAYLAAFAIVALVSDNVVFLLIVSPVVGSLACTIEQIADSKILNQYKKWIEIDEYHARETSVHSWATMLGQGGAILMYHFLGEVDYVTLWIGIVVSCNIFYCTLDIQKILLILKLEKACSEEIELSTVLK